MDAIIVRDLYLHYGSLTALENIHLKVPSGSVYGLIGPNGAGKTSTLRILAGLLEPNTGDIHINGLSMRQYLREIQWQIGFMPDSFGVYEDLLVWEYLDFFARCYKLAPQRRRQVTGELLELVDLGSQSAAPIHALSRGMQQRLCLAHALIHDPQVLLLDEPASGLDPQARVEMRELLRELRAMGKTVLLSSHILSDMAALCDSIAVIERGRIITSGPIEQIRKRMNPYKSIRISVLSNIDAAKSILETCDHVEHVRIQSLVNGCGIFMIDFSGDDQSTANLLEMLISLGVRIKDFSETSSDLEELFLSLTQGEVS